MCELFESLHLNHNVQNEIYLWHTAITLLQTLWVPQFMLNVAHNSAISGHSLAHKLLLRPSVRPTSNCPNKKAVCKTFLRTANKFRQSLQSQLILHSPSLSQSSSSSLSSCSARLVHLIMVQNKFAFSVLL